MTNSAGMPSRRLPWTYPLGSFSEMAYFARTRSPNSACDNAILEKLLSR
jgi:hypothetical protein